MNVKSKQCLLYVAGYDPGPLDGVDGPKTKAAMQKVFEDYGVGEDGLIGILAGTIPKRVRPKTFWDEIEYFDPKEFACPCGRCNGFPAQPDETLVRTENEIRKYLGKPIRNSSGVRCMEHNREVGGVDDSLHLIGKAVDFCCPGVPSTRLLRIIDRYPQIAFAYAIDDSYVHMNVAR